MIQAILIPLAAVSLALGAGEPQKRKGDYQATF